MEHVTRFAKPNISHALRHPGGNSVVGYSTDGIAYKYGKSGWTRFAQVREGFTVDEAVALRLYQGWTEIDPSMTPKKRTAPQKRVEVSSFNRGPRKPNRQH